MRVLHIINSLRMGGAEKLLADSLPLYQQFDVEVDLLLLDAENTPFLDELKQKFIGEIFTTKVKNCYSPLQILAIRKYIKNYDLVHCHLFPVLYWTAIAKMFFDRSKKLIFNEHNTYNRRLSNSLFLYIDRFIYLFYEKIIAITPQVEKILIEKLKLSPQKVEIVYNGLLIQQYQDAQPYHKTEFFAEDDKIIIQISRFQLQKDQKTLIKALTLLPNQYKLLLVGDGELRPDCEKLAVELNLQNRIRFLGNRTDIPRLLKTADIAVQSSHWEGFGLSAVEAMASGKPIIASDVAGLGDVVRGYGLLFEKENAHHLAQQILLLENPELCQKVIEKVKRRASDFHISKMVEHYIKIYRNLDNE